MKKFLIISLCLFLSSNAFSANSEKPMSTDDFAKSFWQRVEETEIGVKKITDTLFLLYGLGGNIAALIGDEGVLIVDDQVPSIIPKVKRAIKKLGGDKIIYSINTHWHFDHSEGNLALDPKVTKIISQSNARDNMVKGGLIDLVSSQIYQDPYPERALPVITHENGMTLYFNNEEIEIVHFGSAHTSGDSVVIFHNQKAVHFGDVFVTEGYPFIDVNSGGSIDGLINFLEKTVKKLKPETIVLPGHGEIATVQDVIDTIEMLKIVRQRVYNLIEEGKTLQQTIDAKPTKEFDDKYPDWLGNFVNRVYTSLKQNN